MADTRKEIEVDVFAGGGGASLGIERATGQVARIGNAVPPVMPERLAEANYVTEPCHA